MKDRQFVSAALMLVLFVGVSIVAGIYSEELVFIAKQDSGMGMFGYILITIISVVAAPLSSLPLMPVAATMWGPIIAAIISIIAWVIGALIAFYIARRYGRRVVGKMISLDHVDRIAEQVLGTKKLGMIIVLRMVIPVDVLSYALGLVGNVSFRDYVLGTCIGVIPFAFVFAYASSLPILPQISMLIGLVGVLGVVYIRIFKKHVHGEDDTITSKK